VSEQVAGLHELVHGCSVTAFLWHANGLTVGEGGVIPALELLYEGKMVIASAML
jgi:hypothetical protein